MHFIYDYGNYNWKEKRKRKKTFIKIWCTIYDHHERGLNDENVQMFNVKLINFRIKT